ncbi:YfcE family phosphodiesterase [Anoxybacter fermentans]|uniref:Phosphoesterase n=1 Tax=Anoxybacter fermentans TaxID=1323375 RepID=A0A3S9SZX8_9FIRM|nr:metallophosphoesterase [Anoxybacter fermentans]AZR73810.1 YfcE family phosphodiesterase [Anoxybacter fermentans]
MIGVLSDTHIPRRAEGLPKEVIQGFKGVDLILHAGDIVEESVLKELEEIAPVYAVYGNCDPPELREKLPAKRIVEYAGFKIGLVHYSSPYGNTLGRLLETFEDDEVDAIVFGHSHRPYNDRVNGILIFNPGSPTDKRFEVFYSYGLLIPQEKKLIGKVKYFK